MVLQLDHIQQEMNIVVSFTELLENKQHAVEATRLQTKSLSAQKKACGIILKSLITFLENKKTFHTQGIRGIRRGSHVKLMHILCYIFIFVSFPYVWFPELLLCAEW
jgi:hypothetical protein